MDFPTAWRLARSWPAAEHEEPCSYRVSDGAFLCDCTVLNRDMGPLIDGEPPEPEAVPIEVIAVDNGFFASEQDAVAEEAAWADQMAAEMDAVPSVEIVVPESPSEPQEDEDVEDAPINPLDIPDHYDLPIHGSIQTCPKCGNGKSEGSTSSVEFIRTTYHPGGVLGEPCGERFGFPDVQNLGEHLCRRCKRCHYGWPEAVWHG